MMIGHHATPSRPRKPTETARFVLLVDRQVKRGFDERDAAEREAQKILSRFPHLNVAVEDREGMPQRA